MNDKPETEHVEQAAPLPEPPGRRLREARKAKGMSPQDVAASLRLTADTVDALERDDFDNLPEPIFVRGYIRSYAVLLGLPVDELVSAYNAHVGAREPPPLVVSQARPQASAAHRIVRSATVLIILALAALVAWWWKTEGTFPMLGNGAPPAIKAPSEVAPPTPEPAPPQVVPEPPAIESQAPRPPLAPVAQGEPAQPVPPAEPAPPPEPSAAVPPEPAIVEPAPPWPAAEEPAAEEPAAEAVEQTAPTGQPEPGAPDTLSLRFEAPSWVEVHDARERRLLYRLGRAGETHTVQGEAPFRIFLGNAPGVRVQVNGESYDVSRHVRRNKTARFSVQAQAR